MACRGIKGATCCSENSEADILEATRHLLQALVEANSVLPEDLAAVYFSCTPDLTATFPARAARELGLLQVPLLCAQEIAVPGALPRCIRVLMLVNSELPQSQMRHRYLREAAILRPDLSAR